MRHPPTTYTDGNPLTARSPRGKRGQKRSARQRRRARTETARVRAEAARALAVSFAGLEEALALLPRQKESPLRSFFGPLPAAPTIHLKAETRDWWYGKDLRGYFIERPLGGVGLMYPLLSIYA